ncbi:MAG: hypothetical protein E7292_08005 [Lachnospiraceae bacterium]|nr:hypothetical protein [Lachnospiraceae bacterium]
MGFISFHLDYYRGELQKLDSVDATPQTIYHAKQLLKMLDDLLDEGYTELNEILEESCQGVSRLREYLRNCGVNPFSICHKTIAETDVVYEQKEMELTMAINELVMYAKEGNTESDDAFLAKLICFCEWIGYNEDTAYIFLLRDTLLPYVYYQNNKKPNIYPWLLGRKTLTMLTGKEFVDDEIRASIIKALEIGRYDNYDDFCKMVLPDMRTTIRRYPEIENCLTDLLKSIKEKHIVVIESGCSGTFPMLLKCLDERVDVRMYTTYPYLLKVYGDKIYSPKYEENRLFETMYSQDLYFQFSAIENGKFFVRKCKNKEVEKYALAEVKATLR